MIRTTTTAITMATTPALVVVATMGGLGPVYMMIRAKSYGTSTCRDKGYSVLSNESVCMTTQMQDKATHQSENNDTRILNNALTN